MKSKEQVIVVDAESSVSEGSEQGTSSFKVAFNIMKTIIGAGIFGTPYALKQCGFWFGMFLIIPMGFIFFWTIMTLVRGAVRAETTSMQGLIRFCYGFWGTVFLNVTLLFLAWGFLTSYTVIIGDELPSVLKTLVGEPQTDFMKWFLTRRAQVILTSVFILLPVSMSRSLAGLAKFSGIALAGIVFIIGCVVGVAPSVPDSFKGDSPLSIISARGIPSAIGILAFAYVCQHNVLLNYTSLKDATPRKFRNVAAVSITVTIVLTIVIGCAHVVFREKSEPNILGNFPTSNTIMIVCKLLFGLDMFFTYPLQLFVFRDTFNHLFFGGVHLSTPVHSIITTLTVGSTMLVGCLVCDLGIILELTGGITGSMIALIIPCVCWIRVNAVRGEPLTIMQKIPYICCIIFGFVLMILSIIGQVIPVDPHKEPKNCNF